MVEDGDVVEIEYVGRTLTTGEIFDLTSEETAEAEGHDVEDMDLGPLKVLIGAGHVIPGLEDALRGMDAGDKKEVEIPAEDAFGERSGDDVKTIPQREFDEYDVQPHRGLVVEVDGRRGKIISTSSGRVRVDFNHPLAGQDLEYEVEVLQVLDDPEDRINAVLAYYGLDEVDGVDVDYDEDDQSVTVTLPDDVQNQQLVDRLQEELELIKGVDTATIK